MCMFLSFIMYALPLEIQLSIRKGWELINWFIPTTCVCLYQTRIMIVNSICLSPFFYVQWVKVRGDCSFVDIGGIIDITV